MAIPADQIKDKLFYNQKNSSLRMSDEELAKAYEFCEDYKHYLDDAKTEREAVDVTIGILEKNGFVPLEYGKKYAAGDKVYYNNRGKALICATIGSRPLTDGLRIAIAHIDCPRIDLKPNPLYESSELAYFKTHYYGGIKKYQWTTVALSAHGVIVKKDGTKVTVCIGEDESDPAFCILDLLPHLAREQSSRTLADGIRGEELNILLGSNCYRGDDISEPVKTNILNILFEKYGVTEEDFLSAELTFVPAAKARDIGLDRSMIGAYGHDDRV
ncbi:MAG: aminopeptidase, partial [Oscillospiraceae bacterium]|nr:aminopeptidase [Oscillospiraceae bacterium]